jgi:hypothetical protein
MISVGSVLDMKQELMRRACEIGPTASGIRQVGAQRLAYVDEAPASLAIAIHCLIDDLVERIKHLLDAGGIARRPKTRFRRRFVQSMA